jgi:hypothetical protein
VNRIATTLKLIDEGKNLDECIKEIVFPRLTFYLWRKKRGGIETKYLSGGGLSFIELRLYPRSMWLSIKILKTK